MSVEDNEVEAIHQFLDFCHDLQTLQKIFADEEQRFAYLNRLEDEQRKIKEELSSGTVESLLQVKARVNGILDEMIAQLIDTSD